MIWGLIVALVVAGALALVLVSRSHAPTAGRTGVTTSGTAAGVGLDPVETASIGAALEAIGGAHADAQQRRLQATVEQLIERRVPARAVEVVPGVAEGRVRFADGTTVRARGLEGGDLGILAAVIREGSILPASCARDAIGISIVFDQTLRRVAGPVRPLAIRVVGIDQPD